MKRSNQFNLTKESIVLFTFGLMFILYSALTDDYYATLHVQAQLSQQQQQEQQNSIVLDVVSAKEEKGGDSLSLNSIFKQVENSVVQITRKVPPPSSISPPSPESENATALGSGFVYDNKGHIITNNHVVGNAKIVDVTLVDGNRYTANVIGTDIFNDIAVIEIVENLTQQSPPPPPKPLMIGNSSELEVGEQVIAIGNPFGLVGIMTTGIVSQTGQTIEDPESGLSIPNAIQTDALINPGNSGGPLLNMNGQVIGMNTAGFSGIGLAIPSNAITRIVPALIEKGNYTHPWLGLTVATLTSDLAESVGGLERNFKGVLVDSIVRNGPADKAGVNGSITDQYGEKHGGDIITAVDGHNVIRTEDLVSYLEEHKKVGDKITLTIYRNGQFIDLEMILQERPLRFYI
ncbi:MAG TPA: trypsin-like peptidase domain-containing protein [Nitrososphaeraceae archaeon]|nr:trypsin-like peptidase domain-containing protein [Nitrososphaeraceae archaeon]